MPKYQEYAPTTPATDDILLVLDVSDATDGAAGTTKKITLGDLPVSAAQQAEINAASSVLHTFNDQFASYTITASDVSNAANGYPIVTINNASANTLTIPPNSSVAIGVGKKIDFIQDGVGQTTITAGAGVTLHGTPGLKCRAQYSPVSIVKRSTDVWYVIGDLSA